MSNTGNKRKPAVEAMTSFEAQPPKEAMTPAGNATGWHISLSIPSVLCAKKKEE